MIHFAGLKAVGDSVEQPMRYYGNNVIGSLRLFEAIQGWSLSTGVQLIGNGLWRSPKRSD